MSDLVGSVIWVGVREAYVLDSLELLPSLPIDRDEVVIGWLLPLNGHFPRYGGSMSFTRITVRPEQMNGVPCVPDLRIPVATVVGMVEDGMSEAEIITAYPDLEVEDVREAIAYYRHKSMRDRDFELAGNFERVDPDSHPISEIPEDESMHGFGT